MCSAEVILGDKNTGKVIMLSDTDLNISSTLTHTGVSFTNDRLMWNRQYMFRVNARNINGSAISSGDISKLRPVPQYSFTYSPSIGTYDVVKSGIHTNPLRIHTEYLPNTNAAGVLYGFFYIGESDIDFSRSSYFALSRNESLSHELPSLLSAGVYYVHSYVIEQDKLLQSGEIFPATTKSFSGTGNSESMRGVCECREFISQGHRKFGTVQGESFKPESETEVLHNLVQTHASCRYL